jgi:16S rRNA (guanine(966)-N(2))-methyltransferase RsmD
MKLFSPKATVSRPITDRVKESLFNVLYNYRLPEGKIVADLFCGVGSLGLEALSRGAEFVTFVEQDQDIILTLERNIAKAGFVKDSKVIRADAFKTGAHVEKKIENSRYDLVFVDPPYAFTENVQDGSPLCELLGLLGEQVVPNSIVVVRTERHIVLLERYGRFSCVEQRQWGSMAVSILRNTIE